MHVRMCFWLTAPCLGWWHLRMPFLFNLDFVLFPAFAVQFNSLTRPLFPSFDYRPAPPPFFAFLQRLWFFGCLFTANWIKFKSSAVLIFVAVSLNEYTNALPSSSHQWRIWYLQPGWLINSATGGSNLFLFSLNPFFPVPYLCSCWNIVLPNSHCILWYSCMP